MTFHMFFVCLFVYFQNSREICSISATAKFKYKKNSLKVSDNEIIYGDKQRTLLTAEVG